MKWEEIALIVSNCVWTLQHKNKVEEETMEKGLTAFLSVITDELSTDFAILVLLIVDLITLPVRALEALLLPGL